MARAYKEMGYTGLIISDHFLNGNTTVDKTLPWEQQVAEFERGYLAAKEEGDKIGLDVFFAWECSMSGDFLIYGLDKEWLLANPDQMIGSLGKIAFQAILMIFIMTGPFMLIAIVIGYVVYLRKYRIDAAFYERIVEDLKRRGDIK